MSFSHEVKHQVYQSKCDLRVSEVFNFELMILSFVLFLFRHVSAFSNETYPIWVPKDLNATHAFLRPKTLHLDSNPSKIHILVSAAPDGKVQQRVLAAYRLYVNGEYIGIGPGRAEKSLISHPKDTVVDEFQLDFTSKTISFALQCYHENGGN